MTADEARDLVDRLWAQYTPWMQRAFVGTLDGFDDDNDYVYGPEAFVPPKPTIHYGQANLDRFCDADVIGCATSYRVNFDYRWIGQMIWRWSDASLQSYEVYGTDLTVNEPGRLVLIRANRVLLLHEIAHAITGYGYVGWSHQTTPPQVTEYDRVDGHNLAFKCLTLDLYRTHTSLVPTTIYAELNRLCNTYASDYPTR